MLEARLLVKVAGAYALWQFDQDGQDEALGIIEEAISTAADSPYWEIILESFRDFEDKEGYLRSLIDSLCLAIGDKIHRRNLQIADLKRQLNQART